MSQLASSVNTSQQARVIRKIPVGAIMVLAVLGVTEMGPLGSSVLTLDAPDWKSTYGGHTVNGDSVLIAEAYFNNGGSRLRQSRVVHHTDATDPLTKASAAATLNLQTAVGSPTAGSVTSTNAEPFALVTGDDLDIDIDGGGPSTATFTGTAATITAGNVETYALANGETLLVEINNGGVQTITFLTAEFVAIGAATAAEVAAVINAKMTGGFADTTGGAPRITTDLNGTGSEVDVSGGTANAALGFSTTPVVGGGNVANIAAVTGAETKTIVEAAVAGSLVTITGGFVTIASTTTGVTSTAQVQASSTADDEFGFDNAVHTGTSGAAVNTLQVDAKTDGVFGNTLTTTVAAATAGDTDKFNFQILKGGIIVETWENVSMTDTDADYVETKLNHATQGSKYVTVLDLDAAVTSPGDLPATGTFGPLTGGDDGLTSLADTDFVGGAGVNGNVGLRTFDPDTDIDVIVVPDRATSTVHNAMLTYSDITREGLIFAVLDPPAGLTTQGMATYVKTTAALFNATENAAIYWPRVKVANPNKPIYGNDDLLTVPPSGHMTGVYARVDASKVGGAFEQPAGTDAPYLPKGIEGFENDEVLNIRNREILFPLNINPISKEDGTQIFIDGARNLDITGNWPSVGQRRGTMFVEKRLRPGLAFLRHRNTRPRLYNDGKLSVQTFLLSLTEAGAFKSKDPTKAFSVDFGPALNTASVAASRQVKARVGMATSSPAEFINVEVGPDNDDLAAQLAALAA